MVKTIPNRRTEGLPTDPNAYKKELIKKAKDFYLNRKGGKEYFDSLSKEQKISAGNILQFRDDNFDALGFTKDGLGESSPLYGKRFDDNQFVEMFDQTKNFIGPGLREGATPEHHLFRPEKEPALKYFLEGKMGQLYRPDDSRIFDNLGFPEGAKIKDQTDEKGRIRMNIGGATYSVDRKTYTPEEYQSSFIDYYGGFGGIDVKKAPPPADADPADTVTPDILSPVDDDGTNIFNQMNIATGRPTFSSEDYDYNDYIKNFGETEQEKTKAGEDKSLGGFVDWAKNQLQTKPEILVGAATGVPGLGAVMAVGAAMNRKQQLKNANKIAESGGTGGAMFKVNNQVISRAPGSRIYDGTLGDMTQQQVANVEAIRRGFIPGTMQENQVADEDEGGWQQTGKGYLTSIGGAAMDAYGNVHSASGIQGASASEATALREKLFVDTMKAAGISLAGVNVSSAALEMKQALDANMKGGIGTFETVRRQDGTTYNNNLGTAQGFVTKYVTDKYGSGTAEDDGGDAGAGTTSVAGRADPRYAGYVPATGVRSRERSSEIVSAIVDRVAASDDKSGGSITPSYLKPESLERASIERAEEIRQKQAEAEAKAYEDDPDMFGDDDRPTFRDSEGRRDSVTITVDNVSKAKDYEDQYDEDDFIDESGRFTEGFGEDDSDSGDSNNGGCVIATHGLSTGGFTPMEKAKAELWCKKTYHGKWYGEAFRRGYRAAGQRAIDSGNAEKYYQEFKDFVAYGRGVKRGWRLGFNYYLRTLSFFLSGLFISE